MRNPNGFGTTYKLKGSRRNPWRAAIPIARNEKGRIVYKTIGYYKNKKLAILALENYHNYPTDKAEITLEQLYKEWSVSKYQSISAETVKSYNTAWNHFEPLKKVRVRDIRAAHWQSLIDGKGLSWSALHKIKTVAGLLSKYALQNDIILKDYSQFVRLPKKAKKSIDVFTDIEIGKLKELKGDRWVQTVLVLIYTGMRINEMVSLTLFQIDKKNEIITVGSKTDAGNRVIPIHKTILPFIEALPATMDGVSADRYRKEYYYPSLDKAGVRKLTPHKCRHTLATILAREGVDTLSIQRLMGHTDYSLTANVYTHPEVQQLKSAIDKI